MNHCIFKMFRRTSCSTVAAVFLLFLTEIECDGAPSVIIVGAGSAGIAAATRLLENNITNVTILEAEGRIGGRIHSVKFGDAVIDLGAQWCHGEEGNIVYELVKDLDVLEPDKVLLHYYHSAKRNLDQLFLDELYELFYSIYYEEKEEETSLGDYMIKRYNESIIADYGDEPEKIKLASKFLDFLMKSVLTLEGAFSWFDVSAKSDYKECRGNHLLSWKGRGYKTVLDVLMKKYPQPEKQLPIDDKIILNKDVIKITWDSADNPQGPTAECLDGSVYRADYIIFTPSLGVLKERFETLFQPALPKQKITVIKELGIAAIVKVFLHFPERWWPENNFTDFSFIWSEDDKQLLLQEFPEGSNQNGNSWLTDLIGLYVAKESPNVLVAWFCGEFVPQIEQHSDVKVTDGVMFALNKFLGHQFRNIPTPDSLLRHNWYSNPHFRGAYSFQTIESRKGNTSPEIILSQPLTSNNGRQTLMFAGEATHPFHYSTVHGAIETGHREAQRIINLEK